MKKLVVVSLLFIVFGLRAQTGLYLVGGVDSYKVLNEYNPSGNGFHFGLLYLLAKKNKTVNWGIESVFQFRSQFLYEYNGANPSIARGPFYAACKNLQINPFIRLLAGAAFIDGGIFTNLRFSADQDINNNLAAGFDAGLTGAMGLRVDPVQLSVKFAYGLVNINQNQLYYLNNPKYNSFNLSLEAGIRLTGGHKK